MLSYPIYQGRSGDMWEQYSLNQNQMLKCNKHKPLNKRHTEHQYIIYNKNIKYMNILVIVPFLLKCITKNVGSKDWYRFNSMCGSCINAICNNGNSGETLLFYFMHIKHLAKLITIY